MSFCMHDIVNYMRKRGVNCCVFTGIKTDDHVWRAYMPKDEGPSATDLHCVIQ
jgi:hypothetical protein